MRKEIADLIATDKELEATVFFIRDIMGDRCLEVRYRYPDKWIKIERISAPCDDDLGWAELCFKETMERLRYYIDRKGDVAEGIIVEVGGYPCDRDCGGDGNNPYSSMF